MVLVFGCNMYTCVRKLIVVLDHSGLSFVVIVVTSMD